MNKKGFTLIEILAVLVIMSVLAVAGYAGVGAIKKNINNKEYDAKVKTLESAAIDYGESNYSQVVSKGSTGLYVSIKDLYLAGYINADNENINKQCGSKPDNEKIECILADPRDESKHMCGVTVKVVNNRVTATYETSC